MLSAGEKAISLDDPRIPFDASLCADDRCHGEPFLADDSPSSIAADVYEYIFNPQSTPDEDRETILFQRSMEMFGDDLPGLERFAEFNPDSSAETVRLEYRRGRKTEQEGIDLAYLRIATFLQFSMFEHIDGYNGRTYDTGLLERPREEVKEEELARVFYRNGLGREMRRLKSDDPERYSAIVDYFKMLQSLEGRLREGESLSRADWEQVERLRDLAAVVNIDGLYEASVANERGIRRFYDGMIISDQLDRVQYLVEDSVELGERRTHALSDEYESGAQLIEGMVACAGGEGLLEDGAVRGELVLLDDRAAVGIDTDDIIAHANGLLRLVRELEGVVPKSSRDMLDRAMLDELGEDALSRLRDYEERLEKAVEALGNGGDRDEIYGELEVLLVDVAYLAKDVAIAHTFMLGYREEAMDYSSLENMRRAETEWDSLTKAGRAATLDLKIAFDEIGFDGLYEAHKSSLTTLSMHDEQRRMATPDAMMEVGSVLVARGETRERTLTEDISSERDLLQVAMEIERDAQLFMDVSRAVQETHELHGDLHAGEDTLLVYDPQIGETVEVARHRVMDAYLRTRFGEMSESIAGIASGEKAWADFSDEEKKEFIDGLREVNMMVSNQGEGLFLEGSGRLSGRGRFERLERKITSRLRRDYREDGGDRLSAWADVVSHGSEYEEDAESYALHMREAAYDIERCHRIHKLARVDALIADYEGYLQGSRELAEEAENYTVGYGAVDVEALWDVNEIPALPYWMWAKGEVDRLGDRLQEIARDEGLEGLEELSRDVDNFLGSARLNELEYRLREDEEYIEDRAEAWFYEGLAQTVLAGYAGGAVAGRVLRYGERLSKAGGAGRLARLARWSSAGRGNHAIAKAAIESPVFHTMTSASGHEGWHGTGSFLLGYVHTFGMLTTIGVVGSSVRAGQMARLEQKAAGNVERELRKKFVAEIRASLKRAGRRADTREIGRFVDRRISILAERGVLADLTAAEMMAMQTGARGTVTKLIHDVQWFAVEAPTFQAYGAGFALAEEVLSLNFSTAWLDHLTEDATWENMKTLVGLRIAGKMTGARARQSARRERETNLSELSGAARDAHEGWREVEKTRLAYKKEYLVWREAGRPEGSESQGRLLEAARKFAESLRAQEGRMEEVAKAKRGEGHAEQIQFLKDMRRSAESVGRSETRTRETVEAAETSEVEVSQSRADRLRERYEETTYSEDYLTEQITIHYRGGAAEAPAEWLLAKLGEMAPEAVERIKQRVCERLDRDVSGRFDSEVDVMRFLKANQPHVELGIIPEVRKFLIDGDMHDSTAIPDGWVLRSEVDTYTTKSAGSETRRQQALVFEKGRREQINAHGTGTLEALIDIMIEGEISRGLTGPLIEGDPLYTSGRHGPYYVIVDEGRARMLKESRYALHAQAVFSEEAHITYLVPTREHKVFIGRVLDVARRRGMLTAAEADVLRSKVQTYQEFADVRRPSEAPEVARMEEGASAAVGVKRKPGGRKTPPWLVSMLLLPIFPGIGAMGGVSVRASTGNLGDGGRCEADRRIFSKGQMDAIRKGWIDPRSFFEMLEKQFGSIIPEINLPISALRDWVFGDSDEVWSNVKRRLTTRLDSDPQLKEFFALLDLMRIERFVRPFADAVSKTPVLREDAPKQRYSWEHRAVDPALPRVSYDDLASARREDAVMLKPEDVPAAAAVSPKQRAMAPSHRWKEAMKAFIRHDALYEAAMTELGSDRIPMVRSAHEGSFYRIYHGDESRMGLGGETQEVISASDNILPSVVNSYYARGWQWYLPKGFSRKVELRVYVTLSEGNYERDIGPLTEKLVLAQAIGSASGRFYFKVDPTTQGERRRDHVVIYFNGADAEAVISAVKGVRDEVGEARFDDKGPYLTRKLGRGLSLGEEPPGLRGEESFGTLRTKILASAWREIERRERYSGPLSEDDRLKIIAEHFSDNGISLEDPAFSDGYLKRYPQLARFLSRGDEWRGGRRKGGHTQVLDADAKRSFETPVVERMEDGAREAAGVKKSRRRKRTPPWLISLLLWPIFPGIGVAGSVSHVGRERDGDVLRSRVTDRQLPPSAEHRVGAVDTSVQSASMIGIGEASAAAKRSLLIDVRQAEEKISAGGRPPNKRSAAKRRRDRKKPEVLPESLPPTRISSVTREIAELLESGTPGSAQLRETLRELEVAYREASPRLRRPIREVLLEMRDSISARRDAFELAGTREYVAGMAALRSEAVRTLTRISGTVNFSTYLEHLRFEEAHSARPQGKGDPGNWEVYYHAYRQGSRPDFSRGLDARESRAGFFFCRTREEAEQALEDMGFPNAHTVEVRIARTTSGGPPRRRLVTEGRDYGKDHYMVPVGRYSTFNLLMEQGLVDIIHPSAGH